MPNGGSNYRRRPYPAPDEGGLRRQTTEIALPVFGYKNHVGIDRTHGFVRWRRSPTPPRTTAASSPCCSIPTTWRAASGRLPPTVRRPTWRSSKDGGLLPQFQLAKPRRKPMPAHIRCGNATRAKVRAKVEHVFAAQKRRLQLVIHTVGLARAAAKITLANLAYNFTRLAWLQDEPRALEPHRRLQGSSRLR